MRRCLTTQNAAAVGVPGVVGGRPENGSASTSLCWAAALASYAKHSEDDALLKMATRIKARATRRAGELLKQIDKGSGKAKSEGDHTFCREDAAREAGMSKHQQVQATRVANVPEEDLNSNLRHTHV